MVKLSIGRMLSWPLHSISRTFSGFAGDNEFKSETNKLREIVKEKYKDQVRVQENRTICIAYDPPYKLFNRRNEVMLIAK